NLVTDELGLKKIALDELAENEDTDDEADISVLGPELETGQRDGSDKAGDGAEIGNEAQNARHDADDEAEFEADKRKARRIKDAEEEADKALPAQEARQHFVDLAGKATNRFGMFARQKFIDA